MKLQTILTETKKPLLRRLRERYPNWPKYVIKDWLYTMGRNVRSVEAAMEAIESNLAAVGVEEDAGWELVKDFDFHIDIWEPVTKELILERMEEGHEDEDIPLDRFRHDKQAQLAKAQGGIRKEPVILVKTSKGYKLLEGWHRTIQHHILHPDGYKGPAYVAESEYL